MVSSPSRPRRRAATVLAVAMVTLLSASIASACGGGSSPDTAVDAPDATIPADVVVATDPATPISVAVGHRFAIVLPADPGDGWRWAVQPFDTTKLVALGSEFSDDDAQRRAATAATSTTSTVPPGRATATSTTTTTTLPDAATTTTTSIPPLVQIVSFAGRAQGTATVAFKETRIVNITDARPTTVTWTVQVGPATTTTR